MTTENFVEYSYDGIVIPYEDSGDSQELALGTGSVIKVGDTYHAYYTAHNPYKHPKEVVLRATSNDLVTWTKDKTFALKADDKYNIDDFRDPYVFFNEDDGLYWMLMTTRLADDGIILKLTSDDLDEWKMKACCTMRSAMAIWNVRVSLNTKENGISPILSNGRKEWLDTLLPILLMGRLKR